MTEYYINNGTTTTKPNQTSTTTANKNNKQQRKMARILGKAWNFENSHMFQQVSSSEGHNNTENEEQVLDLTSIGQQLDKGGYNNPEAGWKQFSIDIGYVYNRHIMSSNDNTNITPIQEYATDNLNQVIQILSKVNIDYGTIASNSFPTTTSTSNKEEKKEKKKKKRKYLEQDQEKRQEEEEQQQHQEPVTLNCHVPKKKFLKDDNYNDSSQVAMQQDSQHNHQQHQIVSSSTTDKNASSLTLTQREELAMTALQDYIESCGGSRDQVVDYRIRMKPKSYSSTKNNKYDTDYFSPHGRSFKAKKEIAKFLNLKIVTVSKNIISNNIEEHYNNNNTRVTSSSSNKKSVTHDKKKPSNKRKKTANRRQRRQENNNDYKKLQKELDKLLKSRRKASKTLEDKKHKISNHNNQEQDLIPDETFITPEQQQQQQQIHVLHTPDSLLSYHPLLPKECTSDVIMSWDFVCSFSRVLLLDPIELEEFVAAFCHTSNENLQHNNNDITTTNATTMDDSNYFPIYLAEIHLCILKVLLNDQSCDDWWWSTLETPLMEVETITSLGGTTTSTNTEATSALIESESSDEDQNDNNLVKEEEDKYNNDVVVTSHIPPKPVPSFVDLLLPPSKPPNYLITPHTWPVLTGAVCHRILHKFKRQRNEVDDEIRQATAATTPPLILTQRRRREELASQRIFSECMQHNLSSSQEGQEHDTDVQQAINHLTSGKPYLQLSVIQRLRILRILVEALYDTHRIHTVLEDNFKSRRVAQKQLEVEERKFKKLRREKINEQESIARHRLANDAKFKLLNAKFMELVHHTEINNVDHSYLPDTDSFMQDPTLIVDFLEDESRDAYDALPTPDSYSKSEVNTMMSLIHDESLFDVAADTSTKTDTIASTQTVAVEILTLQEIHDREDNELLNLQKISYNNADEDNSQSLISKKQELETLRQSRNHAIDALKDMLDGGSATIKSLKSSIKLAKSNLLTGTTSEYQGRGTTNTTTTTTIWALDLVRDALTELKTLENKIDVVNAQKDLMIKRDKCFVRMESLGEDRFRNRYWYFSHHDNNDDGDTAVPGKVYLEIEADHGVGFQEEQEGLLQDLTTKQNKNSDIPSSSSPSSENSNFVSFCKQEYHPSATFSNLPNRSWGVYSTDNSLHALVKALKENGIRESILKMNLKEILESKQQSTQQLSTEAEDDVNDVGQDNYQSKLAPLPLLSSTDLNALIQSYRNSMGKFTGRNNDAPYSSSPFFLAKVLLKKESEYYSRLARIQHSNQTNNTWGGKNGLRNAWIYSMKEVDATTSYTNALETVRNGLITLEGIFFELTDGVVKVQEEEEGITTVTGKELLQDDIERMDIELESITGVQNGIWNSIESRLVFLEIVSQIETSCGILALGLELICRNCDVHLKSVGAGNSNSTMSRRNNNLLDHEDNNDECFAMTVGVTTRRRHKALYT